MPSIEFVAAVRSKTLGTFAMNNARHDLALGINRAAMHFDGFARRKRIDLFDPYAHKPTQLAG